MEKKLPTVPVGFAITEVKKKEVVEPEVAKNFTATPIKAKLNETPVKVGSSKKPTVAVGMNL